MLKKPDRPLMSKGQYYKINSQLSNSSNQYCICTNETGQTSILCPFGLSQVNLKINRLKQKNGLRGSNSVSMEELKMITNSVRDLEAKETSKKVICN